MEEETENKGIHLLKKGKKRLFRVLFSRIGVIALLLVLQVIVLLVAFQLFEEYHPHIYTAMLAVAIISVLYLINSDIDNSAQVTWLILVAILPFFGGLLLLYTQLGLGSRTIQKRVGLTVYSTRNAIPQNLDTWRHLADESPETMALARYLARSGCFPVFSDTKVTYLPSGEEKLRVLLPQLEQAKTFIFLEYFIIEEGLMWSQVEDVLVRKARQGVDVRVMYDGTCEIAKLPRSFPKQLRAKGIHCKVFSPLSPFLSTSQNYRDHRKILVIDGHTAFTGGINLADEYINAVNKFGHWKDVALMLQGQAAQSFTLMFLQMWNVYERTPLFTPHLTPPNTPPIPGGNGYVIPYSDCPLDRDKVGERVYMDILNRAQRYVHIMSPYLILDGEMETALRFAAERGVDVALILPGTPDKKAPYALAKNHYAALLSSGIRIYEYTPGFVHAKVFVSDDCKAVVGTINLDYRSLYHHFECAAYLYQTDCIPDIERDFQQTLTLCRPVTWETVRKETFTWKLAGIFMKAIAPLL